MCQSCVEKNANALIVYYLHASFRFFHFQYRYKYNKAIRSNAEIFNFWFEFNVLYFQKVSATDGYNMFYLVLGDNNRFRMIGKGILICVKIGIPDNFKKGSAGRWRWTIWRVCIVQILKASKEANASIKTNFTNLPE